MHHSEMKALKILGIDIGDISGLRIEIVLDTFELDSPLLREVAQKKNDRLGRSTQPDGANEYQSLTEYGPRKAGYLGPWTIKKLFG